MTLFVPTPRPHLPQNLAPNAVTGPTFVLEAVLDGPADQPVRVPGWTIRAWPVARLGDVTLEAHPHDARCTAADLAAALRDVRVTPLGPIRARRS
ncbi:hypothetical protein HNQ07_003361 [Deinococcus metalli]|uniref:Uncharacterized protein n=1 Tax=Deinococcus metalli TaxID=1141878 RepID=A0A7W8KGP7_9DEIO|nr:hypothetical protein [Deinococcus metalli]MBB5377861.1 hypothetical protein [Deinococcus metalli]GHF55420.1 hypothetical protein GCM10017781_34730 [Deinococcus metalli]